MKMISPILKDKNVLIISGSPGTGKTTLAKQLFEQLKENAILYDDYSKIFNIHNEYFSIEQDILSRRHTNSKIIITTYGRPHKQLDLSLKQNKNMAWLLTSLDYEDVDFYNNYVGLSTLNRFRRSFVSCVKSKKYKRTTRPFLMITHNKSSIGRYKL